MNTRQTKRKAEARQVERLSRRLVDLNARSERFVRWRVGVVLLTIPAALAGFQISDVGGYAMIVLGIGVFMVLARYHGQVKDAITRHEIWREIKRMHLARIDLDWSRIPKPAEMPPPENHPFAIDLDMIGNRSVHQLLDTAVSKGGSLRLRTWLLQTEPDIATSLKRQKLVRELIPLEAFRDRLALNATLTAGQYKGRWDGSSLLRWLEQDSPASNLGRALPLLIVLSITNIVLFLLFSAGILPPLWIGTFALFGLLSSFQWRYLAGFFDETLALQNQVLRLSAVLSQLESYHYGKRESLAALCAPIVAHRPSHIFRRLSWITAAASFQRNPIIWAALNFIVPWDIGFAYLLERHKTELRDSVPQWLDVLYELEALNALATFADLNPDYVFPQIDADTVFKGDSLGHPLIHVDERVTNDFAFNDIGEVVILTGSNMSGKSSFLRTLGVNLQLAYAGGVVSADSLQAGMFRVFTSIRVSDSLADGFSYFYAEVRRLRALLDALHDADKAPLFFLIDEIFRGTNNMERLIGSRSYIRALVDAHGVGIIATHDLELVKLGDESAKIDNYHFREDVIDGKIAFDYVLRPGPCPTTNALKIMALEGLPVEE